MAKAEILFKVIRKWEGGWSDHKNDKGKHSINSPFHSKNVILLL